MGSLRSVLHKLEEWWFLLLVFPPILLCLHAIAAGQPIGTHQGELWGHLFTHLQVERWAFGLSSIGEGDLLNAPNGQAFWPTNPVMQIIWLGLASIVGTYQAWNLSLCLMLIVAGLGPALLCRSLGCGRLGALLAGWLLQLAPYLVRSLIESIVEVSAIGILALCIRAAIKLISDSPESRAWWRSWILWTLLLAGTSPYYMVYLAIGCALCTPWVWRRWQTLCRLGLSGAVIGLLFLAPLLMTESGEHGRLGPEYSRGGYQLEPAPLERADGERVHPGQGPEGLHLGGSSPQTMAPTIALKNPLGWSLSLAFVAGLGTRRSRVWALAAGGLFLFGPGPLVLGRALQIPEVSIDGPLIWGMRHLPLTSSMGNPLRLLAPLSLLLSVAGGLALHRRPAFALSMGLLVFLEAHWVLGAPGLPSSAPLAPATVNEDETIVVFPSGEPPYWSWRAGPKEALYLAARGGNPVAQDYGRGRPPGDLHAHLRLATEGGLGLGREAWRLRPHVTSAPPSQLLLLESRLDPAQLMGIRGWLAHRARLISQDTDSSTWEVESWDPWLESSTDSP